MMEEIRFMWVTGEKEGPSKGKPASVKTNGKSKLLDQSRGRALQERPVEPAKFLIRLALC